MDNPVKTLEQTSLDSIGYSFQEAFKDYPSRWDRHELETLLNRRGFKPELSFGIFEENEMVSFILNGIGMFNGLKTAYDSGTGTLQKYQGRGYASQILRHAVPVLQEHGIQHYLLEVLKDNEPAIALYRKMGFTISREFNYFRQDKEYITRSAPSSEFRIAEIGIPDAEVVKAFWDFQPSWQNHFDALTRPLSGTFLGFGAFKDQSLVGYCIIDIASGDLSQIAVHRDFRRKGAGSSLLNTALEQNQYPSLKVVNTEVHCTSITGFMKSRNIQLQAKQLEMICKL